MKIAVSWSGGMESCLTFLNLQNKGHKVEYLVVFVSDKWPLFCHPMKVIELQSKAINIPLVKKRVKEPYKESYRKAIINLIEEGIEAIATGDLYVYDKTLGRWMDNVCEGLDISVLMPLWGRDPLEVLNEEMSAGFKSIFTCLKQPIFTEEWLGRELNRESVDDLKKLAKETGMDPCGEKGEYHSMAIDGPIFKKTIKISKFSKEKQDNRLYIKIREASLNQKS